MNGGKVNFPDSDNDVVRILFIHVETGSKEKDTNIHTCLSCEHESEALGRILEERGARR